MKSSFLLTLSPPALALLGACAATPNPTPPPAQDYVYVREDCPPGPVHPQPARAQQDPRYAQARPMRIQQAPPGPAYHGDRGYRGVAYGAPRLSISLGQRSLDNDYAPTEDQVALGIEFSQQMPDSALGWELGLIGSYDEDPVGGFNVESSTFELYGGVRATLARGDSPVRPYIGAGGAWINAYFDASGIDDHDSSPAAYAHAGVEIEVSPVMAVGLDLRGLFGSDIDLFGVNSDADYTQLTAFISLLL